MRQTFGYAALINFVITEASRLTQCVDQIGDPGGTIAGAGRVSASGLAKKRSINAAASWLNAPAGPRRPERF